MNKYPMVFAQQHWSPCLRPGLVRLLRPLRRRRYHRGEQLNSVQVSGLQPVQSALAAGQRLLIAPNHPSHSDPFAIYEACQNAGTACHIMAAWHVFWKNSAVMRQLLRWHGCFSIDREANDLAAFRDAVNVLCQRPEPLVIFPEGDIYHCNDRLTPFREGAFAIALAAAKRASQPVKIVPAAIRYRCATDPMPAIREIVSQAEQRLLWRPQREKPIVERIRNIGYAVISLKEQEYFGGCRQGLLSQRIAVLAEFILNRLEAEYSLSAVDNLPKRVKNLRHEILTRMQDPSLDRQRAERLQRHLDEVFLALQLFSYPGDYLDGSDVSLERIAETVDKMEEDVLQVRTASIRCRRDVHVHFGEPIPVPTTKSRELTHQLTLQVEEAVRCLLNTSQHPEKMAPQRSSMHIA